MQLLEVNVHGMNYNTFYSLEYMYSVGEQLQPTHNSPNVSLHPHMGTCMLAAATSQLHRRS